VKKNLDTSATGLNIQAEMSRDGIYANSIFQFGEVVYSTNNKRS